MIQRTLLALSLVMLAASGVAENAIDLPAKYKAIIERGPFGQVKGVNVPDVQPWLQNWVFAGIVNSNTGAGVVQAIIATKDNQRWFFRTEGETVADGIVVQKIDLSERAPKLVLKNGLETGTLTYPERSAAGAAAPPAVAPAMPGQPGQPGEAPPPTIRRIPFRRSN
jgi:hypothetical protein